MQPFLLQKKLGKGYFGSFGTHCRYFHYFLWEKLSWLTTSPRERIEFVSQGPLYLVLPYNTTLYLTVHHIGEATRMFTLSPPDLYISSSYILILVFGLANPSAFTSHWYTGHLAESYRLNGAEFGFSIAHSSYKLFKYSVTTSQKTIPHHYRLFHAAFHSHNRREHQHTICGQNT
jgi:hypothetical protein